MDEDGIQADAGFPAGFSSAKPEFFGSYSYAIDVKGRIIVPNPYREALGVTFTVSPTRDFKGVALYPNEAYNRILEALSTLNQLDDDVQQYTSQFYKLSYRNMQTDGQGRLLLPPILKQRILHDAKDLEISGDFTCVRIMEATKAKIADTVFTDNLDGVIRRIAGMGMPQR